MNNKKLIKKQLSDTISKLKATIAHPSVSALIYGYLKEKNLNLKEMSVNQWKEIEKDIVELILAETFPGEEISEDQLTFTSLANSIGFMATFINKVNQSLDSNVEQAAEEKQEKQEDSTSTKFEL